MKKFTHSELTIKLMAFSEQIGKTHISRAMIDKASDMPSSVTFKRYFGSWSKALLCAGLDNGIITGRPQAKAIKLTNKAIDIIEGELLGDGSFDMAPTANAYFSHSTTNINYSKFLYNSLISENVPLQKFEFLKPRGGKPQTRIRSISNKTFGNLRERWYPDVKIVPSDFFLNKTRCLFWYLGDGYSEDKTVKFSTCGFTEEEVERLADMLTGLGFRSSKNKRSGGYYIVRMSKLIAQDFLNWIGPCPVLGYEHKWIL